MVVIILNVISEKKEKRKNKKNYEIESSKQIIV